MNLINSTEWLSKPRIIAGLMTGTSLDAVDVAVCKFSQVRERDEMNIIIFDEFPIPSKIKRHLRLIIGNEIRIGDVSEVNFELARLFAEALQSVCRKNDFNINDLDALGIHGQTVWHEPPQSGVDKVFSTLQLGSGSALAKLVSKPVVYDFRSADIALGGQAAPLVPIFDFGFLRSDKEDVIALNIGGMANLTYLPQSCERDDIIAFDTGPGNVLIDAAVKKFFDMEFDEDGKIASSGNVIGQVLQDLLSDTFVNAKPPKSTGREYFNEAYLNHHFGNNNYEAADIVATCTYFTPLSIAKNIQQFAKENTTIYVSGGGVKNKILMEILAKELPQSTILTSDTKGIPYNCKEAVCFAYLAWLNLSGKTGNIKSVTGASKETILGSLAV